MEFGVFNFEPFQDGKSSVVPTGLTGDLFKDTELVEKKVNDICSKIDMTEKEKEKLRLNLMTKGLNIGMGVGRGRRVNLPRPRSRGREVV